MSILSTDWRIFHAPFGSFSTAHARPRHWESFHGAWAAEIMAALNRGILPEDYFTETQVSLGGRVEVDFPSFQNPLHNQPNGAVAVALQTWAPPAVDAVLPTVFPDEFEVLVYGAVGGPTLVAAVELVSPRTKIGRKRAALSPPNVRPTFMPGLGW